MVKKSGLEDSLGMYYIQIMLIVISMKKQLGGKCLATAHVHELYLAHLAPQWQTPSAMID